MPIPDKTSSPPPKHTRRKREDDFQTIARVAQDWSGSLRTSATSKECLKSSPEGQRRRADAAEQIVPRRKTPNRKKIDSAKSSGKSGSYKQSAGETTSSKNGSPSQQRAAHMSPREKSSVSSPFTTRSQHDIDSEHRAQKISFLADIENLMHPKHLASVPVQDEFQEDSSFRSRTVLTTPPDESGSAIVDVQASAISFASTRDGRRQVEAWPPQGTCTPGQNPSKVSGAAMMRRALETSIPMDDVVRGLMERLEAATSEVVRQRGLAMSSGQEVLDIAEEKAVLEGKFLVSQNDLRAATGRAERLECDLTRAREGQRRAEHMAWMAIQALERETRRSGAEREQTMELEEALRELVKQTALQQGHNWRVSEEMGVLEEWTVRDASRRGAVTVEDTKSEGQMRRVWGLLMEKVVETDRREADARDKCVAVTGQLEFLAEEGRSGVEALIGEVDAAKRWVSEFMATYELESEQEIASTKNAEAGVTEVWGLTQSLASDLCASNLAVEELKGMVEEATHSSASMQRALEREQNKVSDLMLELVGARAEREKEAGRAGEAETALRKEQESSLLASTQAAREREEGLRERERARLASAQLVAERQRASEGVSGLRWMESAVDRAVETMADCLQDLTEACEGLTRAAQQSNREARVAQAARREADQARREKEEAKREEEEAKREAEQQCAWLDQQLTVVMRELEEEEAAAVEREEELEKREVKLEMRERQLTKAGGLSKRVLRDVNWMQHQVATLALLAGDWKRTEHRASRLERKAGSPTNRWKPRQHEKLALELGQGTAELIEEAILHGMSCSREVVGGCKIMALRSSIHNVRIIISDAGEVTVEKSPMSRASMRRSA